MDSHSPPKNPPSKKSSASEFLNLTLHAREARGAAQNQWLSLLHAKQAALNSDLVSVMVSLYNQARTYFTQHPNS